MGWVGVLRAATLGIQAIGRGLAAARNLEPTYAVVALDWTEFDADDQSVIALYLVSSHGRATPWPGSPFESQADGQPRYT